MWYYYRVSGVVVVLLVVDVAPLLHADELTDNILKIDIYSIMQCIPQMIKDVDVL